MAPDLYKSVSNLRVADVHASMMSRISKAMPFRRQWNACIPMIF